MSDHNANNCAICLESLTSESIGSCVPCGHCFHVECFSGWAASQLGQAKKKTKCPTCNTQSKDFCRLFLDLATIECSNNDNDSFILSSSSSSSCSDDSTTSDRRDESKSRKKDLDGTHSPIVDLTWEFNAEGITECGAEIPLDVNTCKQRKKRRKKCTHSNSTPDLNVYKRAAKRFKHRLAMCESQCKRHNDDQRKLTVLLEKHQQELRKVTLLLAKETMKRKESERENESIKLLDIEHRDERDAALDRTKQLALICDNMTLKLRTLEAKYKYDIERAQVNSMKEVSHILVQHPKLTHENKALREKVLQLDAKITELKKGIRTKQGQQIDLNDSQNQNHVARRLKNNNMNVSEATKILCAMDNANQLRAPRPLIEKSKAPVVANTKSNLHISSHAVRLSRASETQSHRRPNSMEILDAADKKREKTNSSKTNQLTNLTSKHSSFRSRTLLTTDGQRRDSSSQDPLRNRVEQQDIRKTFRR